ncbi:ricin B lectin domain-containing protein [Mycena alexandri]|uniref:Ricin B lectin domain-containing protein n=1 Tax=Mycena alexandri TaxID=1745969 RepID=A0AAD6WX91_9AGAR|nr:ricin B lectin domain-containing protein [Mycena alexandri]
MHISIRSSLTVLVALASLVSTQRCNEAQRFGSLQVPLTLSLGQPFTVTVNFTCAIEGFGIVPTYLDYYIEVLIGNNGHEPPIYIARRTYNQSASPPVDTFTATLPYWAWFAFPGAQYQFVLDTSYMIPGTNGPPVLVVEGTASAPINITGSPIPVYIRPTASSGKCLTAASNTNGAAVEIEDCVAAGSTSQKWTNTGTTLQIFGNKCLDVTNGATADGTKLQIWTCATGNTNQEWMTFGSSIQWSPSSCLDLTNGVQTDGNLAQIWTCTDGPNQQWTQTSSLGVTEA